MPDIYRMLKKLHTYSHTFILRSVTEETGVQKSEIDITVTL